MVKRMAVVFASGLPDNMRAGGGTGRKGITKSDDKVQAFLDELKGDEMEKLLEMLKKKM